MFTFYYVQINKPLQYLYQSFWNTEPDKDPVQVNLQRCRSLLFLALVKGSYAIPFKTRFWWPLVQFKVNKWKRLYLFVVETLQYQLHRLCTEDFSADLLIGLSILGHWFNGIFLERCYVISLHKSDGSKGKRDERAYIKRIIWCTFKYLFNHLSQCTLMFLSLTS